MVTNYRVREFWSNTVSQTQFFLPQIRIQLDLWIRIQIDNSILIQEGKTTRKKCFNLHIFVIKNLDSDPDSVKKQILIPAERQA